MEKVKKSKTKDHVRLTDTKYSLSQKNAQIRIDDLQKLERYVVRECSRYYHMILKPSFDRVESQELDIKKFIEMLNFFKSLVDQSSDQVTYGLDLSRTPLLRDSYYRDQESSIFKLPLSSDKHDNKKYLRITRNGIISQHFKPSWIHDLECATIFPKASSDFLSDKVKLEWDKRFKNLQKTIKQINKHLNFLLSNFETAFTEHRVDLARLIDSKWTCLEAEDSDDESFMQCNQMRLTLKDRKTCESTAKSRTDSIVDIEKPCSSKDFLPSRLV